MIVAFNPFVFENLLPKLENPWSQDWEGRLGQLAAGELCAPLYYPSGKRS
jgi:hypothetical protein